MRLAELQDRMQTAILDPDHKPSELGLRIHHSHFWNRMRDFVAMRHPLLAKLVGEGELVDIVRRFIRAHPPATVVPSAVPAQLAQFLASASPWCEQPIVAELAAYDFARTGAALHAEEATVTRAELAAIAPDARPAVMLRLKKRTALVVTRYRFHAVRVAALVRTAPLDAEPTYLLVHVEQRTPRAVEIDHRTYLALQRFGEGGELRALAQALRELGFTDLEIESLLARWLDAELLVGGAS